MPALGAWGPKLSWTGTASNSIPIVNAGVDQLVITGELVTVIGGVTGDYTSVLWRVVSDPTGNVILSSDNSTQTSFTTNNIGLGEIVLGFTAVNVDVSSDEDFVSILINDVPNLLPTADAGNNITGVYAGASFQLRAVSIDGDGVVTSYEWTQVSGDDVLLVGASTINPTGIAPSASSPQTLVFEVVAIDERGGRSEPSQVSVGVNAATSTAVVTIAGLADGDYTIKLISDTDDTKIYDGIATFTNNEARVITAAVSGTPFFGRWLGTPAISGTGLYGVTENV